MISFLWCEFKYILIYFNKEKYLSYLFLMFVSCSLGLAVDGDPHFIIELPDQNDALCFNIDDKPGTIFNLVSDPLTGDSFCQKTETSVLMWVIVTRFILHFLFLLISV